MNKDLHQDGGPAGEPTPPDAWDGKYDEYEDFPLDDDDETGTGGHPVARAAGLPSDLAPPKTITQQLLGEFLQLKALNAKFKAADAYLKAALQAGVPVEPGPHAASLECHQARYLTAPHLIKMLGLTEQKVKSLRASAELRTTRRLRVQ